MANIIKSLKELYHKRGLQLTVSISFTILTILAMLVLVLILSLRSEVQVKKVLESRDDKMVKQLNQSLTSRLHYTRQIINSLYYSSIKNNDLSSKKLKESIATVYDTNRSHIVSIVVFDENDEIAIAEPVSSLKKQNRLKEQDWYQASKKESENIHISRPHVQEIFRSSSIYYPWVISFSTSVELVEAGKTSQGLLLLDLDYADISGIFSAINTSESSFVYLEDEAGNIIYHPNQQLIEAGLGRNILPRSMLKYDGSFNYEEEGEDYLITVQTVGYTGWKIIAVSGLSKSVGNPLYFRLYAAIFVFVVILIMSFANFFVSFQILRPVKQLEEQVNLVESGQIKDLVPNTTGPREVDHLSSSISAMLVQEQRLRDKVVSEQEAKTKSELNALQAQINPHFLYNTLDSIVWMVEAGRQKEAVKMVTSLASFFRKSLAQGKNIIPVARELEQIKSYLEIQKVRYKDKFNYEIMASEEAKNCETIKLIIQPLVENAIYHGVSTSEDEGLISIKAYCEAEKLILEVKDNGMGIPKEKQKAILEGRYKSKRRGSSGIAIANVMLRIKLNYGEDYGVEIISEADEGCIMRIVLPQREYQDEEV